MSHHAFNLIFYVYILYNIWTFLKSSLYSILPNERVKLKFISKNKIWCRLSIWGSSFIYATAYNRMILIILTSNAFSVKLEIIGIRRNNYHYNIFNNTLQLHDKLWAVKIFFFRRTLYVNCDSLLLSPSTSGWIRGTWLSLRPLACRFSCKKKKTIN